MVEKKDPSQAPTQMDWDVIYDSSSCEPGMKITVFDYRSDSVLYPQVLCVRSDGKLSFSAFNKTSPWHGSWTPLSGGRYEATFHFAGNEDRMKTATMMKESDHHWIGIDQSGATINMHVKFECTWCHFHECWHKTEDGLDLVV